MRLLCFGDSYAVHSNITPEQLAQGCVPSWCDLVAAELNCPVISRGVNGTSPQELLYQLINWQDWRQGDRVICLYTRNIRYSISPNTPSLHSITDIFDSFKEEIWGRLGDFYTSDNPYAAGDNYQYINLSQPRWDRILHAYKLYAAFLNNSYHQRLQHEINLLALDRLADREGVKFYLKYCFADTALEHDNLNIELKHLQYIPGAAELFSDEIMGVTPNTNHFTHKTAPIFAKHITEAIV